MGNCFSASKKLTPEIPPYDFVKTPAAANAAEAVEAAKAAEAASSSGRFQESSTSSTTVRLYGSPTSYLTAYIRLALLYKSISPKFIPCETPIFETETPTILHIGSESVSGSRQLLLDFIERKFPNPPLTAMDNDLYDEMTPSIIVKVTWLQHKSLKWHMERTARWAEDLAKRGGKKAVDPAMGSPRMEVRKFGKSYSQLLELMLEHAQMEERVVFPVLEKADRGLCKAANEEHARDLPIMNGIKEDIKSVGVLDSGSPAYREILCNISTRLKSLKEHSKEHFEEEERDLLPLIEATDLNKEQLKRIMVECVSTMQGTHSHLLNFFLEGLVPQEAMQYLDSIAYALTKNELRPRFI